MVTSDTRQTRAPTAMGILEMIWAVDPTIKPLYMRVKDMKELCGTLNLKRCGDREALVSRMAEVLAGPRRGEFMAAVRALAVKNGWVNAEPPSQQVVYDELRAAYPVFVGGWPFCVAPALTVPASTSAASVFPGANPKHVKGKNVKLASGTPLGLELQVACVTRDGDQLHTGWPAHAQVAVDGAVVALPRQGAPLALAVHAGSVVQFVCLSSKEVFFVVRTARPMTPGELYSSVPPPESEEACRRRVPEALAADEDVVVDSVTVSTVDPITRARIKTPARCSACTGLDVFDLDAFLGLALQARCMVCPLCRTATSPAQLRCNVHVQRLMALAPDATTVTLTVDV